MAKVFKRRVSLRKSSVVLRFAWVVVAVFGPSIPLLNVLIALLAKIYSVLLFGSNSGLLATRAASSTEKDTQTLSTNHV
eukprot:33602-Amphidinium_carterae.1